MWIILLPLLLNLKMNPSCLSSSNLWTYIVLKIPKNWIQTKSTSIEQWAKQSKAKQNESKQNYHILHGLMVKKKETSYQVPPVDSWLWWRSHCHNLPRHSHHINFQYLPYMSHHGYTPSLVWDPHCPEYLKNKWLAIVLILKKHT